MCSLFRYWLSLSCDVDKAPIYPGLVGGGALGHPPAKCTIHKNFLSLFSGPDSVLVAEGSILDPCY